MGREPDALVDAGRQMALQAVRGARATDEFTRLHGLFVQHFGFATGFVWLAAIVAATQAPWVRNFRGLLDPMARAESTWSFLFALPVLMTAAWLCVLFGADTMRRGQLLKNQNLEFGLAGLVAFAVFCMAIHRAVVAFSLGS
jgi:hypothetical protein